MHQTITATASSDHTAGAATARPARGIDGWPLNALLRLDRTHPGLIARLITADDLRRQAVFAALSRGVEHEASATIANAAPAEQAALLLQARVEAIVTAAFGSCPSQLLALLRRLGPQPQDPTIYGRLHALAADPAAGERVSYLAGCSAITVWTVDKAEQLRPELLRSKLASSIYGQDDLTTAHDVMSLVLEHSSVVTPECLAQSLSDVTARSRLNNWLYGLVRKIDKPLVEPPFFGDENITLLSTAPMLLSAAKRYNNCLKTMLGEALSGRSHFYEFQKEKVIAHVRMLTDHTGFVEDFYNIKNKHLHEDLKRDLRDRLAHLGLPSLYRNADRRDLKSIASLHTPWRFGDEDLADDGEA